MWPNGPCSASRWWSRNKEEENISPEGAKSKVDGEWERKSGRGRRNDSRGEFVTSRNIIWLKVKSEGSVNCEILFNSKPFWRLMWTSLLKAKDAVARSWVTLADSLPRVYFSVFQVTWFCCFSDATQIFLGAKWELRADSGWPSEGATSPLPPHTSPGARRRQDDRTTHWRVSNCSKSRV